MIERTHNKIGMRSGAIFSDCETYRYRLWREWEANKPAICFVMLNPSTADELANDPTIERCQRRAIAWGYGRVEIVNLFALRSTDPRALYGASADPVGPDNMTSILKSASLSDKVICAWGKHGAFLGMGDVVMRQLRAIYPGKAHALKLNGDGTPSHPLYLPYNLEPFRIA